MRFGKRRSLKSFETAVGSAIWNQNSERLFDEDGRELELRHKTREVLAFLIKNAGQTVSREALIASVWEGRTVAADSVAQCIAEIRRVLVDTEKRTLETVPREGYRLIVDDRAVAPRRWETLLSAATAVVAAGLIAVYGLGLGPSKTDGAPPVIAVLPFEDFSSAPHQGFLSDAVAESIITALARNPQHIVISRRSSFQFRNSELGVSEIADQLGANFVLEGSQQFDGERVRITAQLIAAENEAHIWAEEIDVPLDGLLEANTTIGLKVAHAVGTSVVDTAQARLTEGDVSALMISNAAQSRIMRNFSRENLLKNIEDQERSIQEFPDSSWSYLGLALALRVGLRQGWIDEDEQETRQRMQELARHGVAIDPNNFMAFHALGRVLMFNRDVEAATGAFRKGLELNPSSAIVADALAESLIFAGKTDEALMELERLELIDPLYGFGVRWTKGLALWQMGDCKKALNVFQSTPSMPLAANKMLAAILHCLGQETQAADAMAAYLADNPNWTLTRERA